MNSWCNVAKSIGLILFFSDMGAMISVCGVLSLRFKHSGL